MFPLPSRKEKHGYFPTKTKIFRVTHSYDLIRNFIETRNINSFRELTVSLSYLFRDSVFGLDRRRTGIVVHQENGPR